MDQLAVLTLEFYAIHPDLEPPAMPAMSAPQLFLLFNSVAFYLQQNEKTLHPDLEARYTTAFKETIHTLLMNQNAKNAIGGAIAHEILRIAAEANITALPNEQ